MSFHRGGQGQWLGACLHWLSRMPAQFVHFVQGQRGLPFQQLQPSLAIRDGKQHAASITTVQKPFKLSWRRRWRAAEGKCWSVSERYRSAKIGAVLLAPCRAAAESVAFKPHFAFSPAVTPNPSFKRTASPPLNSNVSALNST